MVKHLPLSCVRVFVRLRRRGLRPRRKPTIRQAAGVLLALVGAICASAGALAALSPATAADLGGPPIGSSKDLAYALPPAFTWTGLYVGAHVGYGWSDVDWDTVRNTGTGALVGGQIGYNWQWSSNIVLGIEGDLSGSWVGGDGPSGTHDVRWLASVRGRAGLTINSNRTLFYLTAGGAWADIDYSVAGVGDFSNNHFGWVAGGGIEHMLTPSVTARVEYLYYGFDSTTAPAGSLAAGPVGLDPSMQTVRLGLNFKF
jgi:outer membrane immunogenic protein